MTTKLSRDLSKNGQEYVTIYSTQHMNVSTVGQVDELFGPNSEQVKEMENIKKDKISLVSGSTSRLRDQYINLARSKNNKEKLLPVFSIFL